MQLPNHLKRKTPVQLAATAIAVMLLSGSPVAFAIGGAPTCTATATIAANCTNLQLISSRPSSLTEVTVNSGVLILADPNASSVAVAITGAGKDAVPPVTLINNGQIMAITGTNGQPGNGEAITGVLNKEASILNGATGVIQADSIAIHNNVSTITLLKNEGNITSQGDYVIKNNNGTITELDNLAVIGGTGTAIANVGKSTITTLKNSGGISAVANAVFNETGSTITTITNSGQMTSSSNHALQNEGTIGTISNASAGVIMGSEVGGIGVMNKSKISQINNSGVISGNTAGIYNVASGEITSITNTVAGGDATIGSTQNAIYNIGKIGSIENGIDAKILSSLGAAILNMPGATIQSLVNNGTIMAMNDNTAAIENRGTIESLFNGSQGVIGAVINMETGIITKLINSFGDGVGLPYGGKAPVEYQTGVTSKTNYGKLAVAASPNWNTADLKYGIAPGSTVEANTYKDVIAGYDTTTFNSTAAKTGTYSWMMNNYGYTLQYNADTKSWDLVVVNLGSGGGGGTSVTRATKLFTNTPAAGAASVIDANQDLLNTFGHLTTDAQVSAAASQTLPLLVGGSQMAAQSASTSINRVISARVAANRGLSSGDEFLGDKNFWMKPFGSFADQGDIKGVAGYKARTYGAAVGFDGLVSTGSTRIGAAFAYANSSADSNTPSAPQRNLVDVYQLVGYGSHSLDANTELTFQADFGQNKNKGARSINYTVTPSVASSSFDTMTAHAGAAIARTYQAGESTRLTPSLRADYSWMEDSAYNETGAGVLNLQVGKRSTEQMVLGTDLAVNHDLSAATTLTANVGVGYDTLNKRASINAAFAGAPTAAFTTYGLEQAPWVAQVGFGLVHKTTKGAEVTARLDVESRTGFVNQTASLKARWSF